MLAGESYNARDEELLAAAFRARSLLSDFASRPATDVVQRHAILEQLLGEAGEEIWIEPPFFCDYGMNIYIGSQTFVNANCVFLDAAEIRIGANSLIGPAVQLLTASHPLRAADRIVPMHKRATGRSPYNTHALPIRIGDNVWLGGGTIVLPGITIGDNATIGAGSVVTKDIPADVLAFGNPCRVQRSL